MKTAASLALVAIGGVIAFRVLPRQTRDRLTFSARNRMLKRMEHIMESLPDAAPPKLIMSILPKLKAQNDQIIALLQEQNELLRERQLSSVGRH